MLKIDFDEAVEDKKFDLLVQQEARRQINEENGRFQAVQFSNQRTEPEEIQYRVEGLLPIGGYVLIQARRKSGKTTLVGNLIRALTKGRAFLGEFEVHGGYNRVALLDLEMSENRHKLWLKDMGLLHEEDLYTDYLRGRALSLSLFDDDRRCELADHLSDLGIDVLIVDPLGPLLRAYGVDENSNSEVGRIVDLLIKLKEEAGVSELVIVHHQGKDGGQGARGASVLEDSPDAIWTLKGPSESPADKLFAFGRDVDEHILLDYEPSRRELFGTRVQDERQEQAQAAAATNTLAILTATRNEPGCSSTALYAAARLSGYSGNKDKFLEDLRGLERERKVENRGNDSRPKWYVPAEGE